MGYEFPEPFIHLVLGGGPQLVSVQLLTASQAGSASIASATPLTRPPSGSVMSWPMLLASF
jgi:hypothetical protein